MPDAAAHWEPRHYDIIITCHKERSPEKHNNIVVPLVGVELGTPWTDEVADLGGTMIVAASQRRPSLLLLLSGRPVVQRTDAYIEEMCRAPHTYMYKSTVCKYQ